MRQHRRIDLRVDSGRFRRTVTKHRAYGIERCARAQHVRGGGVAQQIGTAQVGIVDTCPLKGVAHDDRDRRRRCERHERRD